MGAVGQMVIISVNVRVVSHAITEAFLLGTDLRVQLNPVEVF